MTKPPRVKLTFPEALITEPILARVGREFPEVLPNIRRANVEDDMGWIICEMDGPEDVVERAIEWLIGQGVQVDRLGDVLES
ncbi:MAG: NIL domain-containing protein [Acidimicrobiales bacterium]